MADDSKRECLGRERKDALSFLKNWSLKQFVWNVSIQKKFTKETEESRKDLLLQST